MWTSGAGIGLSTVFLNDSGEVDHWPIKAELQTLINLGQEPSHFHRQTGS
jgi:hypothetical protein